MHRIWLSTVKQAGHLLWQEQLVQPILSLPARQIAWAALMSEHCCHSQCRPLGLHGMRFKSTLADFADDVSCSLLYGWHATSYGTLMRAAIPYAAGDSQ